MWPVFPVHFHTLTAAHNKVVILLYLLHHTAGFQLYEGQQCQSLIEYGRLCSMDQAVMLPASLYVPFSSDTMDSRNVIPVLDWQPWNMPSLLFTSANNNLQRQTFQYDKPIIQVP